MLQILHLHTWSLYMFTVAGEDMIMQILVLFVKSNNAKINIDQEKKSSKTIDFMKQKLCSGTASL